MRLLHPNVGECVDRQTILLLKAKAGEAKKMQVNHFIDECNQIQDYLQKNWFLLAPRSVQDPFDRLYAELAAVNKVLWDLEDKIRGYMKKEVMDGDAQEKVVEVAFSIARENDRRASLVHQLNELFGGPAAGEKIYA